jgi:hypothetical protein
MPTIRQFYSDALSDAGLQKPNQTATGNNIDFCHRSFDDMVRTWSKVRERLFYVPAAYYTLLANIGAYQIGPGAAQFPTAGPPLWTPTPFTRPLFIQSAQVIIGNARKFPLNILTRPQWDVLQTQTLLDPDGPTDLFYDFNHPVATIYVAPKPGGVGWPVGQQLILSQWNPLPCFYPGSENLLLENFYPESYFLALRKGLAIQLCDAFRMEVSQQLLGIYQGALSTIEKDNRDKVMGAFSFSRTLETGATKGDGIMPAGLPPGQGQ